MMAPGYRNELREDAVNWSLPYRHFVLLEPGVGLDDPFEEEGCGFPRERDFSFCQGTEHGGVDKGLHGRVGIVENLERPLAKARFVGWVLRRGIGAFAAHASIIG